MRTAQITSMLALYAAAIVATCTSCITIPDLPPGVVPPIFVTTTTTTSTTTTTLANGCGCDLRNPIIKEHREQGHRNDNEGSRNFRTCTDADRGGWFFVDPFNTPWLKGCIETDGKMMRAKCNPATGAHYKGWRNDGDPDKDSDPIRPPVPEFQIRPIAHVYFEHRKVAGVVEPPVVIPVVTGSNPNFITESDIPAPRKPPLAGQDAPKNIKGSIMAKDADNATNIRYGLQGYFRGEGYSVGVYQPDNPKHGSIEIYWDSSLTKKQQRPVNWRVIP